MQEDLAHQGRRLHACLAHSYRIRLINLRFEEPEDQRKQNLAKDRDPLSAIRRSEFGREQSPLQRGDGLVTYLSTRIDALSRQSAKYGRPVCSPGFIPLEVRLLDQR